jgi:carbon-monoxide dehydrogenase medium subunit
MYPASFEYHRPATIDETIALLVQHGDEAKLLAGGHSLIPAMKLRLAMLRERCPLLPETATHIGDVQVRNRGTIGGSLAHADPAGDWPAAILALDAELELAGPKGRRTVRADAFFVDLLQTALAPDEVLCEVRVSASPRSVAYEKTEQKASGFALAGVAVVVGTDGDVRVGITGVGPKAYRASAVEIALRGQPAPSAEAIASAARHAADGVEALGDIHATPEFRVHLAQINTQRALTRAFKAR